MKTAAQELTHLRGEIAFPLINDANVTGLILFGAKRSGDPYFTEDVDLLSILTSQAAVAMQNAQLYRQVVLANEYLDNILSTMESGVIAVDATGRVSRVNPAAERLTGLDSDSLCTASYVELPTMPRRYLSERRSKMVKPDHSLKLPSRVRWDSFRSYAQRLHCAQRMARLKAPSSSSAISLE